MPNLSSFIKNGQNLQVKAGNAGINVGDLLLIGGPGNEAYSAKTIDYAKLGPASTVLAQTSIVASTNITQHAGRLAGAVDANGNIYIFTLQDGSVRKYSSTGSLLASFTTTSMVSDNIMGKVVILSNGNIAIVTPGASNNIMVLDAALNQVIASFALSPAPYTNYNANLDAVALSGGGFAVVYTTTTTVTLATFSNTGAAVLSPTTVQSVTISTQAFVRIAQLTNGNIVVAMNMTSGSTPVGTSFFVVTTAGVSVVARVSVSTETTGGPCYLAVPAAGSPSAGYFGVADPTGYVGVYSNAGALQGSVASVIGAGGDNAGLQFLTDGVQFVMAASNGGFLAVAQIPVTGANNAVSTTTATAVSNSAIDAALCSGQVIALYASSATAQSAVLFGLADPTLGITKPYMIGSPTAVGTAAATTGTEWPTILAAGDFSGVFVYDHVMTAGTFLAIYKLAASAIIGLAQGAVAAGNSGATVAVQTGPGSYPCNALAGTSGGVIFSHMAGSPTGNAGSIFNNGVSLRCAGNVRNIN